MFFYFLMHNSSLSYTYTHSHTKTIVRWIINPSGVYVRAWVCEHVCLCAVCVRLGENGLCASRVHMILVCSTKCDTNQVLKSIAKLCFLHFPAQEASRSSLLLKKEGEGLPAHCLSHISTATLKSPQPSA